MRKIVIAAGLAALFLGQAIAQVHLTGLVVERDDSGERIVVPDIHLLASTGSPAEVVAEAVTDSRGRYELNGLPLGRYTLAVEAAIYYTVQAGGREAETATLLCAEPGDCGQADFEVARAAVVEGWLADDYGEPLPGAQVTLMPESSAHLTGLRERYNALVGRVLSDDRGYYRIWGVKPGRYELEANTGGKQAIEIEPGQTAVEAQLAPRAEEDAEGFRLSGVIEGLPEGERSRLRLHVRYETARRPGAKGFGISGDGRFSFSGVEKGEYAFQLSGAFEGETAPRYLGTLEVDRDLTGVRLSPHPPTGIGGSLEFVDSPARDLTLTFKHSGNLPDADHFANTEAPDFQLQLAGMLPGEYEIRARDEDYYVVDPLTVTVSGGVMSAVVVRVGNQRGSVRGTVHVDADGARAPGSFFTVALRGEQGQRETQADVEGAFVFEKVIPGEYELAAREDSHAEPGEPNVRQLRLKPGFDVEIDLTVER